MREDEEAIIEAFREYVSVNVSAGSFFRHFLFFLLHKTLKINSW